MARVYTASFFIIQSTISGFKFFNIFSPYSSATRKLDYYHHYLILVNFLCPWFSVGTTSNVGIPKCPVVRAIEPTNGNLRQPYFFPPVQLTVSCSTPQSSLPRIGQLKVGRRRPGPGKELRFLLQCFGWHSLHIVQRLLVSLSSSRILVWSNVDLKQKHREKHKS